VRKLFAGLILVLMSTPVLAQQVCDENRLVIRGDWGQAAFTVEIADTPQERARGLMFRESMPRGAGMLFTFDKPQSVSFWMKNTLIALDMLFIDKTGLVKRVHSNAIPGDLTPIPGGDDIFAVLEINGGLAEIYGIKEGSEIRHPAFADGPPAWPC
jgi:uncharacterized protein